ncbi:MAG: hypothetical protein Q7T16_05030 [Candidatus Burarchaeum sp.]|nr:hypothetical protein [Candidatus Burarchaeum sp.]MDO8339993.1 hypothetical protein [Candidatus Burarchaeum sp.]
MQEITAVQVVHFANLLIAMVLSRLTANASMKLRGKSFSTTLAWLSIALLLFAASQIVFFMRPYPTMDWPLLSAFTELLFLLVITYAILKINSSVDAYRHILKKKPIAKKSFEQF